MRGLLGKKIGMTQIFDEKGHPVAVTILEAGPCIITDIKTKEKNGYNAIQIGWEDVKETKLTKPILGIFKKNNLPPKKYLKEFRVENLDNYKIGAEIKVDIFKKDEYVDVTGITKGRGFTGVVKRWGFAGGPKTHGSMIHRKPMSIGDTNPARVIKGKKMPGHYGNEKVTVKNLKIMKIIPEKNLLLVKGAVPGANKGLVIIKESRR
jgi:large subunit ribosomal protein L3